MRMTIVSGILHSNPLPFTSHSHNKTTTTKKLYSLRRLRCRCSSSGGSDEEVGFDSKKNLLDQSLRESDNMNIAVGARKGVIDDLFVGEFLRKDFRTMGVEPVIMSAGELESEKAGSKVRDEEITQLFFKERQMNADFVSKVSDLLWRGDVLKFSNIDGIVQENLQLSDEVAEDESIGGFLQLSKTLEWVSGDSVAPVNRKLVVKDWQNDSEKRKELNLLKYEAIKRELLLLTAGIGAGCFVYCLVGLSVEAALSYAAGVFFSCLYLQLLYYHADNLSREAIPKIFMKKKLKKIGIRSEDLKNTFEKTLSGSTMALSSPRLVIPATIYGLWILSEHILHNLEFQLVPAMLGFFAYKAAALVQVYRDNKDLLLEFSDNENESSS